jgi:TolB-like protein/DNA-binding winged helix-turn-helix (wHTH) protein/Tfp pilus assembly protein PilF
MSDQRIHLFDEFTLDLTRGFLMRGDDLVHLRPQSYEVLRYLVEHRSRLISKDKLIEEIWRGRAVTDSSLGKCIEELREALGPEAREYIRNVRGRGYIFETGVPGPHAPATFSTRSEQVDVVRVTIQEHEELSDVSRPKAFPLPRPVSRAINGWKIAPIAAGVLVLAIGSFVGYRFFSNRASAPVSIKSIAVLPFKNESGSPDVDYLADGMTESLINSLSRMSPLSVKARSSVFRYKGKEIDPQSVAAELSVQAILSGRMVQRGDNLSLYLSLVDGATGNQIWGEQYDRKSDNLLALQRDITRDVSEKLRVHFASGDEQRLLAQGTNNPAAHRAYLQGLYFWNLGSDKSREYFQQAIDLDPNYSLGYAGLAHYYAFGAAQGRLPPKENWPKAEAALTRAMALGENDEGSFNVLAGIQLYYHRDWLAAERSFRKGIELKGDSGQLHNHYARCLYLFGRNDEAIAELRHAIDLEPFSILYSLNLGRLYFSIRQYDNATDQFHKTLELEPNSPAAHDWLGNAYEMKGMQKEAVAEWRRALVLSEQEEVVASLDRAYAASGFEAAKTSLARLRVENLNARSKLKQYTPAIEFVNAYTRSGDKEQAFAWLDKALEERNRFAFEVRSNPMYDNLRSDSRFQASLQKVGL